MTGRIWLLLLLVLLLGMLAHGARAEFRQPGEPYNLVGPVVVSVPSAVPSEKVFSFTTPSGVLGPFTLNVQNGVGTTALPVTEGTVWLDNIQIAGPNDFRPGVAGFSRNVDAGPGAHSLRVVLQGPANSGISLNLVGRKLLPIPVSASPSPTQIALGTKASLAVTLYPAPEKPGKLLIDIAHGFVSAPSQVPFAAGQTQVQVPIRGKSLGLDTLKAKLRGRTVEVPVNVIPTNAKVASLSPSLATLATGGHATVTVALQSALPTSVYVDLATSPGGVISHPPTVLVPANTLQASFTIHGMASGSGQLTASLNGSQATSQFTVLNQSAGVASLQPVASQISAGASGNLTLSLTGTVNSNTGINLSAQPAGIVHVPSSVTVLAGTSQAQVPVQGQAPGTATVRADFNGSFAEAAVQVTSPPVEIASLEPSSLDVYADAEAALSLTLNSAQSEAVEVELAASPAGIISIPATVTVPAGALKTTFQAKALALGQAQIIATLNGKTRATTVNVIPHPLALISLLPADLGLQQGAPGTLTLNVNAAQAEAIAIPLSAAPAGVVQVPASVLLPAGQTSVAVPVNAQAEGVASISASYNGTTVSAQVSVTPPPPVVSELAPPSSTTPKGRPATLTVKLDRVPNSPQVVALSSDMPSVASVPASVTVPAGTDKVDFPVTASQEGQAQITASLNGGSAAASVTVTPAEVVAIALSPIEHTAYAGDRVQYTAQGTYTDASQQDISGEVQWSSSNGNVATIGVTGLADTLSAGSAQIAAAKDGASQQTGLTVLAPPALSLSASKTALKEGETVTLTVTSAVPADETGLEISFSGGGTGSLQLPLSVIIPAGETSATFNVTGQSAGQYILTVSAPRRGDASLTFSIVAGLEITGLSPVSGEAGSLVEIQGMGFDADAAKNTVTFFGNATAAVVEASATSLRVKVPPLAQTGAITVTTPKGTVQSPVFTVVRQQDFALTASPASQILLTGGQAVYSLALSSLGVQSFTGLASLKVTGLPAGVTAKFSPLNLALNQAGSLVLSASSTAQSGSATITVEATALVSGVPQTRMAKVTLDVQSAVGVTGVKGRFVTPEGQGIAGVRVNVDANQTVSDSAGNFLLTGLPAGKVTLRMDATPAHPLYPIWPAIVELESGKLTVLPNWPIVTPPADDKFTTISNATQDQIITDARYPGVGITMPAGVTITGWDGVPKTRMAIERVHPEHLGVPSPPVPTKEHYQLYFGTPMGGIPDQPIPVTLPNVAELEPGAKGEIWYFDGSPMNGVGEWKLAGTATVSEDGATITTDPGQGVPRFCGKCGLFAEACPPIPQGPPAPEPPPDAPPPDDCSKSADPIEYYSGHEKPSIGGLACGGRTPIAAGLSYSPVDAFQLRSGLEGAVGQGWVLDYDIVLAHRSAKSKRILLPPNVRIEFTQQADGSYATSSPAYSGAVLRLANGTTDVWELTHKDGRIWRFGQSDLGTLAASFLTAIVDPQGNATQITRRADHKITAIGSNERAHTYSYGADNLVDKITDPAGREMRFTYNAARRIETVTDADGGVTRYTYVDDNEYPPSPVCTQGTDGLRIKTIQYPGVSTLTENFHASSRRVLRQTSRLGETRFAYQLTGACITHVSDPSTVCTANCPHEDSWEAWQDGWRFYGGQIVATRVTEPSGRETLRRFDARGILLEKTDPDGAQTRKVLDAQNRVVQQTDVLGRVTRYAYDADGNIISQQDPLGRITDTQYDPKWNAPTLITRYLDDANPVVTQIQYHATNGQPTKLIDPENRATTLAYSPKGQLASLADPLGQQTLLAYNTAGDLVEVEDPLGNLTRLATDGAGRTVSATTPKGYDWQQSWNGKSQPRVETDPLGGKIERVYDEAGHLVSTSDQNGNPVERYTYDDRGNVVARTDALNQSDAYQYDSANRLIQVTTRKGEAISYAYDGQGRLIQVSRPDGTTSYSHDAAGRLIQVQDGATRLQYEYDTADRLVREVQDTPNGYNSVEYQYDALDRRVSRTVNGGDETRYTWNKANQLTQIQFRGETTSYQYDAAGRLAQKTLPGGIVQAYQYDAASRLTQIQYKNGATLIDQLDLAYDAEGNIVSKNFANGSLNQDTSLTASFDAANRMTGITVNGKTYALAYDANGNLIGKTNTADASDSTVYTWNTRNRLIGITAPGVTASFQYDPLGRRIERTVNGETTGYLYDGVQAIGEVRGGQTTALLTGLATDEAIAGYASSGRLTQLTDQLGSVIRQINEAGATQSATAYSPYGEATTTGDDRGNSTEYTARENDGTGLYFYRARYYDPVLKRFVSVDPIGTAGGINFYAYVLGDPVSTVDPDGRLALNLISGAVGAVIGGYSAYANGGSTSDIVNGALMGGASNLVSGKAFFNAALGVLSNLAEQTTDPCFDGFDASEALTAGLLGAAGVRDRLPQFSQPNLVAPLGQQVAHEAAAEAAAQLGSEAVTNLGGAAF
jgi:RHS repeat-associated protein